MALPGCVMRKKGYSSPILFSDIPIFWEEAVGGAAVAAPGVPVLQDVPVWCMVLAGLVNRSSKLELERGARAAAASPGQGLGSATLSRGGWAPCHGSTNHHICSFFHLKKKKMARKPPKQGFWGW